MILGYSLSALNNNLKVKNYNPETQEYDSQGNPTTLAKESEEKFFYYLFLGISYLSFFVFPIFVVFMSALYLYKEKKGYFRSSLITLSYVIFVYLKLIYLSYYGDYGHGTDGLFYFAQLSITLILSLIVNGFVLIAVKK